jgi:hypothetical protein
VERQVAREKLAVRRVELEAADLDVVVAGVALVVA